MIENKEQSSKAGDEIPDDFGEWAQNFSQEYAKKNFTVLDYESNYALLLDVTFNGIIAAYRHLKAQTSPVLGWIKANEIWPGDKRNVLIFYSHISVGWYDDHRKQFYDELCGEYVYNVTHWTEMPDQPIEEPDPTNTAQ